MVLRKLSQGFKITMALMLSVLSSGILQVAPAYAAQDKQVFCNIQGESGTWKAQIGGPSTEHEYPLMQDGSEVFVENQSQVTAAMDTACVQQYGTITTPEVGVQVVCDGDDIYSVVDGDNYDVTDNQDGTFTLTASVGFIFSTSGTNTETLTAPADANTVCEQEPETITTPEVSAQVVCDGADIFSVVDGDNYDVTNNGDGTFTLTAATGYVFSTNGLSTETLTAPADANTVCEQEPAACPANQVWFDRNENSLVDEDECFRKVFVCKYVGTPGIDERLQTGNNPISVSVHAIANNDWDGTVGSDTSWFSDAQGRSYVLAYDDRIGGGQEGEPDISECPAPEQPEPQADIDFAVVCVPNGVKVTITNSGDADGSATVNGETVNVAADSTEEVILPYDLGTPFMTKVTVVVDGVTSTQTVNCAPGQGGGQTLGSTTTTPQTLGTTTELPAALPATGGEQNPMLIILASLMAYGVAYFLQGRRQLNQTRA